jgi:hypothetical protein
VKIQAENPEKKNLFEFSLFSFPAWSWELCMKNTWRKAFSSWKLSLDARGKSKALSRTKSVDVLSGPKIQHSFISLFSVR